MVLAHVVLCVDGGRTASGDDACKHVACLVTRVVMVGLRVRVMVTSVVVVCCCFVDGDGDGHGVGDCGLMFCHGHNVWSICCCRSCLCLFC